MSRLLEPQDAVARLFGVQPLDVPQFHHVAAALYSAFFGGAKLLHLPVVLPVKPGQAW